MKKSAIDRMPNEDKIYGCRSIKLAVQELSRLGIGYDAVAVLRLGRSSDPLAGIRELGIASHFVSADKVVATFSHTLGALIVRAKPSKIGKIFLREYNIRGENSWVT